MPPSPKPLFWRVRPSAQQLLVNLILPWDIIFVKKVEEGEEQFLVSAASFALKSALAARQIVRFYRQDL